MISRNANNPNRSDVQVLIEAAQILHRLAAGDNTQRAYDLIGVRNRLLSVLVTMPGIPVEIKGGETVYLVFGEDVFHVYLHVLMAYARAHVADALGRKDLHPGGQ